MGLCQVYIIIFSYSKHFDCTLTKDITQDDLIAYLTNKCKFGLRLNDTMQLTSNLLQYQGLCTTRSHQFFAIMITAIFVNTDKDYIIFIIL